MSHHRRLSCAMGCVLGIAAQGTAVLAQVVRDGSIGPGASLQPRGPAFEISAAMGETAGANLFHSFSIFNIDAGESVTFQAAGSIHNIFARVTGGGPSFVNGRLSAPANLFLANPAGLLFGARAQLDVSGSFHATTADYFAFEDQARFYTSLAQNSVLTIANPRQFGFLADRPAAIGVDTSYLNARSVQLAGGNITLRNALIGSHVEPPEHGIDLVSVASPGVVDVTTGDTPGGTAGFARFGDISISTSDVAASGRVSIRGGSVVAAGFSDISSASLVDIDVDRLELRDSTTINNFLTLGSDRIGDIRVNARSAIDIRGARFPIFRMPGIFAPTFGRSSSRRSVELFTPALTIVSGSIDTSTLGDGAGSNLLIDVGDFRLLGGGVVRSGPSDVFSTRTGPGGGIVIRAQGLVEVSGVSGLLRASNINTSTSTNGAPGSLLIDARTVRIADGGNINSGPAPGNSRGGFGGNIDIHAADSITITGSDDLTSITSTTFTSADAGHVNLTAPRITIADGAEVRAGTQSSGSGGQIRITTGALSITDFGLIDSGTSRGSSGRGGSITVEAQSLTVDRGGQMTTSTSGAGAAGDVTVSADDVRLSLSGTISSASNSPTGNAGTLTIRADRLYLDLLSSLTTRSAATAGGAIRLDVSRWIEAIDSEISTSVRNGDGGGGDITITMGSDPDVAVMILQRSRLTANAERGPGGNVRIRTDLLVPSAPPFTVMSASSLFGVDGDIQIDAPDASILATLDTLPAQFVDPADLIRQRCTARSEELRSSLLVRGRGGLPAAPGGVLPGIDADLSVPQAARRPEYAARVVGETGDGRPVLLAVKCGW